jgi:hypothetical protein
MGISIDQTHDILSELSSRGDIFGYEERVLSFNEMYMDDETRKNLKMQYYAKGYIPLNGEYNSPHFKILPAAMEKEVDIVSIHLIIYSPLTNILSIRMDYTPDHNVYFRPCGVEKNDYMDVDSLWGYLSSTETKDEFIELTKKILDDNIPYDYWETQKNDILN